MTGEQFIHIIVLFLTLFNTFGIISILMWLGQDDDA